MKIFSAKLGNNDEDSLNFDACQNWNDCDFWKVCCLLSFDIAGEPDKFISISGLTSDPEWILFSHVSQLASR